MWFLAVLLVFIVGAHALARRLAERIKSHPNPYPLDRVSRSLTGHETFVTCKDGTQLWTIAEGQGRIVVFAHGYGISSMEWNIVWESVVATGHRAIAFDLRGHGQSTIGRDGVGAQQMADDYRAVLEHYDVRDGLIVGHSTGGFLTLSFLVTHPTVVKERLRGAVICAGLAGQALKGSPQNTLQIPLIKLGLIQKIMASDTYGWFFGASLCGDVPFPAAIMAFNAVFSAQRHDRLIPVLEFLTQSDYYPRLSEIDLPTIIVCGESDKTTPTWHSKEMGQRIAGARNIWIKGKGHLINWEAPEVIANTIQTF